MKIISGIPFREYARKRQIPENSAQYHRLEDLYDQVQQLRDFISHSYQFRPIGRETAQIYFEKLEALGVKDTEKDKLIDNVQGIQSFVERHIDTAKTREIELIGEFEKVIASMLLER